MPALTSSQLQHIQFSVYKKIDTKAKTKRLNSTRRPWLRFLLSIMESTSLEGGSLTYKNVQESTIQETTWIGDDEIEATEPDFTIDVEFGYFNFNIAIKILHDELKRLGYSIMPNGSGLLEERAISKDEKLKLIKYVQKLVEEAMDAYDRRLDLILLRTGASSSTVQPGAFGLISLTPTVGNIGGKARASYPTLQNYAKTGITTGAGGTFRTDMDRALRQINLYGVDGGVPGEAKYIFAGQAFIEGYKAWAEANGWQIHRTPDQLKQFDLAIPDDTVFFNQIPIIHNPTHEKIDLIDTSSPTYTKQALIVNPETWQFRNENGLHKHGSSPQDPPKQRLTRQDLDGTYSLGNDAPASNAIVALA